MNTTIEIIDYTDAYAADFRQLNLEWLEKFNLLESHDLEVIDDPDTTILKGGGAIYLAKTNEGIVGSAALVKTGKAEYELAKMAVTERWQGKGISKLLLEKCLAKAKELGAEKITLFSNHQLQRAIKLYENYGFRHIKVTDSPFETADIKMELNLSGKEILEATNNHS
ncbi:MAG: GNAT family N-acetyltransferase [Chitinophagaceae bacterium]